MLKKFNLIIGLTFMAFNTFAQTGKQSIRVLNQSTSEPIEEAVVMLFENDKLVQEGLTNEAGIWEFSAGIGQEFTVKISHVSYLPKERKVAIEDESAVHTFKLSPTTEKKEEVVIQGIRLKRSDPGTFVNIQKKEIQAQNAGKDMPYILEQTPSVVTYSDAGAGVGYTGMRIRGVDATRINVTLNGIPYNDAEAHGVFWVDMPDLAASVNSIQIQRGVGTSTNGSAAFGASVNLKTDHINQDRFGVAEIGLGSFGTRRLSAQLGSGLTKSGWGAQGRVSLIQSEGFVDRASSDLYSSFITIAHYGEKSLFKINAILGKEITYQSWWGTPQPKFEGDTVELNRYVQELWIGGEDLENLKNSDNETYNYYTYPEQVDNYTQNHFQAFYSYNLSQKSLIHFGANYTRGLGYYEEFKAGDKFNHYGIQSLVVGADTFTEGNVIRRRWLDNHFFGGIFSYNYKSKRLDLTAGGGQHIYLGGHYGEVISMEHASASMPVFRYYENNARKSMSNLYTKAVFALSTKTKAYADAQVRNIVYSSEGLDNGGTDTELDVSYFFFNPKFGIAHSFSSKTNFYATYGMSNREPVRSDLINSSNVSRPEPEQVQDLELGVRHKNSKLDFTLNAYFMHFNNQLVLTGKINDVGASTRENVKNSHRAGIESAVTYKVNKKISLFSNITFSENKIELYTEYVNPWDTSQAIVNEYKNSDIAFSPSMIASIGQEYTLTKNILIRLSLKHVGNQYLDNTSSADRMLDAYTLIDGSIHYSGKYKKKLPYYANLYLYNISSTSYAANGYTYSGVLAGQRSSFNYVYPQAGFNFMLKMGFRF